MTQQLQQQRLVRSWTINLQLSVWMHFTSALSGSCAVSSPGFLTNPDLIQFKSPCVVLCHPPDYPSPSWKWFCLLWRVDSSKTFSPPLLSLHSCSFWLKSFFFLTRLSATSFLNQNDVPAVRTWGIFTGLCVCIITPGYHGAAGGPGVWALAVIFLISIIATGSFILYKFKRWAMLKSPTRTDQIFKGRYNTDLIGWYQPPTHMRKC